MNLAEILMPAIERVKSDDYQRSVSAKIKNMMPEIECSIKEGFRIVDILDVFQRHELEIPLLTFKSSIYRIRKMNSYSSIKNTNELNINNNSLPLNKRDQTDSLLSSKSARQEAVEPYFDANKINLLTKQLLNSLENDEYCSN